MDLLVFEPKGLKKGTLFLSDHSYFEFLVVELTLDFKKYPKTIVFVIVFFRIMLLEF